MLFYSDTCMDSVCIWIYVAINYPRNNMHALMMLISVIQVARVAHMPDYINIFIYGDVSAYMCMHVCMCVVMCGY